MTVERYREIYGQISNNLSDEEVRKRIAMTTQFIRGFMKLVVAGKLTIPKEYEHHN